MNRGGIPDRPSGRGGRGGGGGRGGEGGYRGRGGGGGGGRGGAHAAGDKDRPKKENILDLAKYMDKRITVKFNGGRESKLPLPVQPRSSKPTWRTPTNILHQ